MKLKNIFTLSVFALGTVFFQSCAEKFEKNTKGLEYRVIQEGDGTTPKQGEFVVYNLILKNQNNKDSILISTVEEGIPQVYRYDSALFKNDLLGSGYGMLKKGDSVQFRLPVDSLKANGMVPSTWNTKDGDVLIFDIGVKKVLNVEEFQEWRIEQLKKSEEIALKKEESQLADDTETIDTYLKKEGVNFKTTASGLRYVITKESSSDVSPEKGDEVAVNYVGKLLDGTVFDTNNVELAKSSGTFSEGRQYAPLSFYIGRGQVIKGWDEGISLLKTGEKATLYIPSPLAYGDVAAGDKIPANSILIFDVELVKVNKPTTK